MSGTRLSGSWSQKEMGGYTLSSKIAKKVRSCFYDDSKSFLDEKEKMLKGVVLSGKKQEEDANLEIRLLQRLGIYFF